MSVILSLVLAAIQAIVQVAVICTFGHILARKGYLSQPLQKGLSILSVKFFTPCLLFANTAASVTWDNFIQLWPLPVYFILFSCSAWLLAKAAARPLGLTVAQTRFVTAVLMFSNTNSLPIGLIESLTMSGAVAWLRWHDDDKHSLVAARGIAYIVFYSILGNVVRWSYGAHLLEQDLDAPQDVVVASNSPSSAHTTLAPAKDAASGAGGHGPTIYSAQYLAKTGEGSLSRYPTLRRWWRRTRRACKPIVHYIKPVLTAPFLAALLGLVAALSPLRHLLIEPDGLLHATLFAAIRDCGEAAVPVILVCLGAQLTTLAMHRPAAIAPSQDGYTALEANLLPVSGTSSTITPYPSYRLVVPFVIVSRLVLLPAIALAIVWVTLPFAGGLREDPMFLFTVLLIGACPTTINLMTVCQANGQFERPMGRVLMWEYLLSGLSMVGWCIVFLWIAKRDDIV
ncbi:auxin efflux carrier [Syncephalis pseudoplumigaleata]|uniref:Auxin efflux carrier n=1 Tax=Syncephalis pseudoplumigaleata TaxID=1712513 RepID=A0A4P9Z313_9FUNG|nr:auxin efflux carrier [Syncephalis pseudoplumigaleata]|eukprot:RKP26904.1 auxin efflux carrier [Syncephalis pseudoplumigaleata]